MVQILPFNFNPCLKSLPTISTESAQPQVRKGKIKDELVKIYPNPTSKEFQIVCNENEIMNVYLYNLQGVLVYSQDGLSTHNISIPCNDIPNGYYKILVNLADGSKTYSSIVINKN